VCVYQSLIRPLLLYNSETWTLKEERKRKLTVFEMPVVSKILGVSLCLEPVVTPPPTLPPCLTNHLLASLAREGRAAKCKIDAERLSDGAGTRTANQQQYSLESDQGENPDSSSRDCLCTSTINDDGSRLRTADRQLLCVKFKCCCSLMSSSSSSFPLINHVDMRSVIHNNNNNK